MDGQREGKKAKKDERSRFKAVNRDGGTESRGNDGSSEDSSEGELDHDY
jgi:hypothetical protein